MMRTRHIFALGLATAIALGSAASRAQDGVKRTDIQTHDLSTPSCAKTRPMTYAAS
jgi:hypothetical protein